MVGAAIVEDQLKKIGFKYQGWGRTEVQELQNIILPDEEIYEAVNGFYEGGFALLIATDVRVLLIDKKPLNYLTVEDMRFDMINEIDYNHRLIGAYIKISAGEISLKFTSTNQPRLRKLIGHVQLCMAEAKKRQATHPHLEQINRQLQSYLLAQYQQQQKLQEQLEKVQLNQKTANPLPKAEPVKLSPELSDYLYAQSLLADHAARTGQAIEPETGVLLPKPAVKDQTADLYNTGRQEIFSKQQAGAAKNGLPAQVLSSSLNGGSYHHPSEVHPTRIVYTVLSHILHSRELSRPALPVDSQAAAPPLPAEA